LSDPLFDYCQLSSLPAYHLCSQKLSTRISADNWLLDDGMDDGFRIISPYAQLPSVISASESSGTFALNPSFHNPFR
jgi:hypothetical protein